MSILKQLEGSKLTPEEIQELIALLTDVIPKIESRIKERRNYNRLSKNLGDSLSKVRMQGTSSIDVPQAQPESEDLDLGIKRLKSAHTKLKEFSEILED
jgi:hypothetical protein